MRDWNEAEPGDFWLLDNDNADFVPHTEMPHPTSWGSTEGQRRSQELDCHHFVRRTEEKANSRIPESSAFRCTTAELHELSIRDSEDP
jgi:hypothetical protein